MKQFIKYSTVILGFIILLACSSDDGEATDVPDGPAAGVDRSGNLLLTGASANDLLSNTNFDNLVVEIAFVQGFRPTDEGLQNLEDFLRLHTFKENVEFRFLELPSPDDDELTTQEIADLELENRTAYNDGRTLAVYMYFTDAPSANDDRDEGLVTLGAAFRNTSLVIFERTLRALASTSLLISDSDVETATMTHEFGHIFGLVNLGSPAINDHEDVDAANHCNVPGCLMQAQLQFGAPMMSFLEERALTFGTTGGGGGEIFPVLDSECQLDLFSNGGPNTDGTVTAVSN